MTAIAKTFWSDDLGERLQAAVEAYDLPSRGEFSELDELSARTEFSGIEVHSSAAVLVGDELYAPATVYVTLNYGENIAGDAPVVFNDTYPARVVFSINDETSEIEISRIDVDTSAFFE